jgi:hypothetical protein
MYLEYDKECDEWARVTALLNEKLSPSQIFAIDNPTLTQSFVNQWNIVTRRKMDSSDVFFVKTYTKNAAKMLVMDQYNDLVNRFGWNAKLEVPLLLTFHGIYADHHRFCLFSMLDIFM